MRGYRAIVCDGLCAAYEMCVRRWRPMVPLGKVFFNYMDDNTEWMFRKDYHTAS